MGARRVPSARWSLRPIPRPPVPVQKFARLVWGFSCQVVIFGLFFVLCSLIALQVARDFVPLEAVSSPWPVDRRAKDPSLALGQACPGSEQEGPARGRAVPSQATERRAREVACLPTGASLGGTQPRFLNKLRPAGVMVLSAVCPMRASRNLASGRRAPLCPVRDQRGERVATKNAGLPCLVPAGRAAA